MRFTLGIVLIIAIVATKANSAFYKDEAAPMVDAPYDLIEQEPIKRSNVYQNQQVAKLDTIYFHVCCLKGPIAALYKSALWWLNKNRYISCRGRTETHPDCQVASRAGRGRLIE